MLYILVVFISRGIDWQIKRAKRKTILKGQG